MKKMQSVMTIRLPKEDLEVIKEMSIQEKIEKSTAVRELVEMGKIYFAILQYEDGRISIGKAAEIAGLTISEIIELFAKLGIKSKIEINDYLEGSKVAEKMF